MLDMRKGPSKFADALPGIVAARIPERSGSGAHPDSRRLAPAPPRRSWPHYPRMDGSEKVFAGLTDIRMVRAACIR